MLQWWNWRKKEEHDLTNRCCYLQNTHSTIHKLFDDKQDARIRKVVIYAFKYIAQIPLLSNQFAGSSNHHTEIEYIQLWTVFVRFSAWTYLIEREINETLKWRHFFFKNSFSHTFLSKWISIPSTRSETIRSIRLGLKN